MGSTTKIQWADATWNPVTGCTPVSVGCEHCYAERMAGRFPQVHGGGYFWDVQLHPERLDIPFHWRKPKRIFTCSMGDLFHGQVNPEYVREVFKIMKVAAAHTFIILTKRPENIEKKLMDYGMDGHCGYLSNVWLGVTCENQEMADRRIPILLQIPAAKRFVSVEPMLGPVDLWRMKLNIPYGYGWSNPLQGSHPSLEDKYAALDWVIVGKETGPGARPMNLDWARSLRDQCVSTSVPFFYKNGLLDGQLWQQFPEVKNEK